MTVNTSGCSGASCSAFYNTTDLEVNTTDTSDCTVVSVKCPSSGQQLAVPFSVYKCHHGQWFPTQPTSCIDAESKLGLIIGCSMGAILCLIFIVCAVRLLVKYRREFKMEKHKELEDEEKMQRIRDYVTMSIAAYNLGVNPLDEEEIEQNSSTTDFTLFDSRAALSRTKSNSLNEPITSYGATEVA